VLEHHDALIFDCDGVLINSEEIAQAVELAQLASVGIHYRRDEYAEAVASSSSTNTARCMVVEDSVNGIVAAKRAGMTAIGFTGGGHCLDDHAQRLRNSGADLVFAAHADLAAHLALAP
jgi:beta-phosphoglucomutase-like phosphatase (HAD superfamily)